MKLLLADDHTLFRDALVQYIERAEPSANITIAKDFHEALDRLKQSPEQDLVLLDLRMPGMNGLGGFKIMRKEFPAMRVAIMSGVAEAKDVQEAMELGAVGYFPKTLSGKALLKAVQLVLEGEKFLPIDHNTHQVMPSYYTDGPSKNGMDVYGGMSESQDSFEENANINLTPREREVLSFLLQGAPNKEIANALGLQVVTVKLHVRGVCRKLDAKNRTQAALKAKELGFGP